MIRSKYICEVILMAEICLSDMTAKEIDKITHGHGDVDKLRAEILFINSLIDTLSQYIPKPIINSKKVKFSNNGRFAINGISLSLTQKKYRIHPDEINCISEQQICSKIQQLLLICPNC